MTIDARECDQSLSRPTEPVTVLSQYPLSTAYRSAVAEELGLEPTFLTLRDFRRESFTRMLVDLRRVPSGRTLIGLEDPTSEGLLPILKLVASATPSRTLGVIGPDLSSRPFNRLGQMVDALRFLKACAGGQLAMRRAQRELDALAVAPRARFPLKAGAHRVTYLNTNLWFGVKAGGSVGHISGVVNGLLESGFEVDYLTVGGRLAIREAGRVLELSPPQVYAFPAETNQYRFDWDFERQATPLIDPAQTSFLYQRASLGNFTGVRLSRSNKLPLVVEYNGSEVWVARHWGQRLTYERVAEAAELQTLRHAHVVVTISNALRDELLERGLEHERIVTYPNCFDPAVFDPALFSEADSARLRSELGLRSNACVATFLGTFGMWHGAEVFARAIRRLCESDTAPPDLQFLFVGDGLRFKLVREILDTSACKARVRFAGLVPQAVAPAYLAASDILVSPHVPNQDGSRFFGSPTKLFEYMAMGKAIVASDLDQIGEVLRNSLRPTEPGLTAERAAGEGLLAMLVEPGDDEALARALGLLAGNAPLRDALGRNARREALQTYTWRRHVGAILDRVRTVADL